MPRHRHRSELPDPEDVLAGRAHADARTLIRMIHAVNPTGRAVAPRHREQRYGLKSRLQSLLVREYADDLQVQRDPRNEGLVTLRHNVLGDGCHALIIELEDDARSWVQMQLDLGIWDEQHK